MLHNQLHPKKHERCWTSIEDLYIGEHLLEIILCFLHDNNMPGNAWLFGSINRRLRGIWCKLCKKTPNMYNAALGREGGKSRPSWLLLNWLADNLDKQQRINAGEIFIENLSICARPNFTAQNIREFVRRGFAHPTSAPWLSLFVVRDDIIDRVNDFNLMLFEQERIFDARPIPSIYPGIMPIIERDLSAPAVFKPAFVDLAMFNVYIPLTGRFYTTSVTSVRFDISVFGNETILREQFDAIDQLMAVGESLNIIDSMISKISHLNRDVWNHRISMLRRMFAIHINPCLAVSNNLIKMMANMFKYGKALRFLLLYGAQFMPNKFIEKLRRRLYKKPKEKTDKLRIRNRYGSRR